jgi:hypothetical protein
MRKRTVGLTLGLAIALLCAAIVGTSLGNALSASAAHMQPPDQLPDLPVKPTPTSSEFKGCPPEGNGGDTILNRLKNRDDVAEQWTPVAFHAILDLPWPPTVGRVPRLGWRESARKQVNRFEGTPVAVEGFLALARLEGPEACNCKSRAPDQRDMHVWLNAEPDPDRHESIIVELTPRIRAKHAGWSLETLLGLVHSETAVRISGWLLLDQEHPDQIGNTRGTLWEIHPVMEIEVKKNGNWVKLE